jgi:hypothetical protein
MDGGIAQGLVVALVFVHLITEHQQVNQRNLPRVSGLGSHAVNLENTSATVEAGFSTKSITLSTVPPSPDEGGFSFERSTIKPGRSEPKRMAPMKRAGEAVTKTKASAHGRCGSGRRRRGRTLWHHRDVDGVRQGIIAV